MKQLIVVALLSVTFGSSKALASICYCAEWQDVVLKVRIATYEGDYGASPAVANDGTIYINIAGEEEGAPGHLIARDPEGNEAILLSDTVSTAGPVLAEDGTIYIIIRENNKPVLVALSPGGIELWRSQALSWVLNGPAIAEDGTILVTSFLGILYAFSPEGSLLWQLNFDSLAFFPTTIAPNGNIYIPTMGDENSTNSLLVYSSAGEAIWNRTFPVRIFSGLAFNAAGTAYYGADGLYAFTPDGDRLWKGVLDEYDVTIITGSPVFDGVGNLYVGYQAANSDDEGLPYSGIVSFSSEGVLRWSYSVNNDEVILATPIITNDGVVIFGSNKGNVFKVNAETGKSLAIAFVATPVNDIYSLAIDNSGDIIVNGYGGTVIFSDDLELADSFWPKFMRDNRNSSSASAKNSGGNSPQVYKAPTDVDGDGKSDLLWRSYAKGWNFLWAMDGTQTAAATPINVVPEYTWDMVGQG
ncbi:Outer membrane protein assembly factor BamB, contains PQQ-like beta-propeller repeat, partial [Marisediminitalea aggregata]